MSRFSLRPAGLFWVAGALLVPSLVPQARAQTGLPRLIAVANDSIRLGAGERVTLPFAAVSRIIIEDDEIARASFQNGNAIIEGLRRGDTTVEVYQSDGTPKLLTVQVGPTQTASVPAPTPALVPAPIVAKPNLLPVPEIDAGSPIAPEVAPITPAIPPLVAQTAPDPAAFAIVPAQSQLSVNLSAGPVVGTAQTQFTISYSNPGTGAASDAIVRYALDNRVSYVTDSASGNGTYDAARREVIWNLGAVNAGATGRLTLRIEPIESGRSLSFDSVATIEDGPDGSVTSATLSYSTAVTPLLTIFALPDRFLAGQNVAPLTDVRGTEFQTAVDRLSQIGIVQGYPDGLYRPAGTTQRAEYAVMTLRGLNLRDLRDITQIKFVLGRASTVNLSVADESGRVVATLTRNTSLEAGEHTVVWNGRDDAGQIRGAGPLQLHLHRAR